MEKETEKEISLSPEETHMTFDLENESSFPVFGERLGRLWVKERSKKGLRRKAMEKVEHYVCKVCGTVYADEGKCSACEKNHKKPIAITHLKYLPFTWDAGGHPLTVDVVMEDGKTVTYKR